MALGIPSLFEPHHCPSVENLGEFYFQTLSHIWPFLGTNNAIFIFDESWPCDKTLILAGPDALNCTFTAKGVGIFT